MRWLFRVEGDKKSQYLDTARLSGNFTQTKCIEKYSFSRRSGRADALDRNTEINRGLPLSDVAVDTFKPPAPLQTAVLFLVFNRPDTTAQVFEAIRKARPPRLYVAADGPRPDRAGEAEKLAKVKKIAMAMDCPQ